jgi:hypothetical protein
MQVYPTSNRRVTGCYDGMDSTPNVKITNDCHRPRTAYLREIVKNTVGNPLVEGPLLPVGAKVKLQRLKLNAELIRNIANL